MFSDTSLWYGAMAIVASSIYALHQARTQYEYRMSIIVGFLFANVGFLSTTIAFYTSDQVQDKQNRWIRAIPLMVIVIMSAFLVANFVSNLHEPHEGDRLFAQFNDGYCYIDSFWLNDPSTFLLPQAILYGAPIAWIVVTSFCHTWLVVEPAILIYIIALWYSLGLILLLKARARLVYGRSYEDDSIGYGQIIATGFAAQALLTYIIKVAGELARAPIVLIDY